jgi:hypothetical protein
MIKKLQVTCSNPGDPGARAKASAELILRSSLNAALVIDEYAKFGGEQDIGALMDTLETSMQKAQGNDLSEAEAMLIGQAKSLESIFVSLSLKACSATASESLLRMALKAQNQCRMTLETLATIKNPPVIFARQANLTTGPQQVNNGMASPSHTREIKNESNQLSEEDHELLSNARTSGYASGIDSTLETLGKIDRAKVARR